MINLSWLTILSFAVLCGVSTGCGVNQTTAAAQLRAETIVSEWEQGNNLYLDDLERDDLLERIEDDIIENDEL